MTKIVYIIFLFALAALTGCEKGLSDLNVNTTSPTSLDPSLLLNQAVINSIRSVNKSTPIAISSAPLASSTVRIRCFAAATSDTARLMPSATSKNGTPSPIE